MTLLRLPGMMNASKSSARGSSPFVLTRNVVHSHAPSPSSSSPLREPLLQVRRHLLVGDGDVALAVAARVPRAIAVEQRHARHDERAAVDSVPLVAGPGGAGAGAGVLVLVPLQVALQLATFFRENWLKYAVSCVKRGENLASYTETSSAARRHTAGLLSAK